MDEERFVTSTRTGDDADLDVSLRPKSLADYVGQEKVKANLRVFIEASKKRRRGARPRAAVRSAGIG